MKVKVVFSVLIAATLLTAFLSLASGTVNFSLAMLFKTLFFQTSALQETILFKLRIPATLSAFVVGGLLALAGTLMQALLRNPLADPYILGISGGAAVFNLAGIYLGLGQFWLTNSAFIGALTAMLLVFLLARSTGQWSPLRLLLTGVILAAGWGAAISLILAMSPNQSLHSMLFWLIGDLTATNIPYAGIIILLLGILVSLFFSRALNILARGDLQARSLGINTQRLNIMIYFLSALLTAAAVSIGGTIGFIGLVVPHILRLLLGSDHRLIIPGGILLGGSLLMLANTLARTLLLPQQLPVGIFTAFLGIPLFLYLLSRSYRQWH